MNVSYTFISRILSYNLSYTVLYFYLHYILFIYGTLVCFNLVLFMYCTFICLLPVLIFFIFQFYDLLHSMYYYPYHFLSYTYIISYPIPISCLLSCSGYTPMLYYSFLTYCFIIYFLILTCIVIYFAFAFSL